MAAHNTLGKTGEDAAVAYLERNGYTINHRNWRKNRLELDIVAVKDGLLIVVEVKTRSNTEYIEPQNAVNWQKVRHIVVAADAYIKHFSIDAPVRFDIITVVGEAEMHFIRQCSESNMKSAFTQHFRNSSCPFRENSLSSFGNILKKLYL